MYTGETVKFTCNVDIASGWSYQWYKDGKELSETSETISISLQPSDKSKYSCVAIRGQTTTDYSEEISQNVLEIPVPSLTRKTQWLDVFPDESVQLSCGMSDSSEWIYTWRKDGQEVQANTHVSFDSNGATLFIKSASAAHAGQYTCSANLKGRSVNSIISSGIKLTVYDKKPSATLIQDPDYKTMFPGESVSFNCHINVSIGWEYLWYKDGTKLAETGNKYTIKSVGTTNQGSYQCQAKRGTDQTFSTASSQAISLAIQNNKPKPVMTQQPDVDKVYNGEPVSFSCKVELTSGWEYSWFKDGVKQSIKSNIFTISAVSLSDSGTYDCMATRNKTMYETMHSDKRILQVSEIPVPSLTRKTQWLDVFPDESVQLSCGMSDSSEWIYTWRKDGQEVQANTHVSFDSNGATLFIKSASAAHAGPYTCSAKIKGRSVTSIISSGLKLIVYDTKPRVTLMQNPSDNVLHTGDSVTFSCHINVSTGWEYLWYKDGVKLDESGNNHTIPSVLTKDTGKYKCQTKRGRNTLTLNSEVTEAVNLNIKERPQADVSLLTGWSEVFSTDNLVLKCVVKESEEAWNYTWFKEDQPIDEPPTEKYTVTPQNNPEQSLYACQGIRNKRPFTSKPSDNYKTKNLLLKRRLLLSILGCIFFGIIAVFIGCIVLRITRKPAKDEYRPEETELFFSMSPRKDGDGMLTPPLAACGFGCHFLKCCRYRPTTDSFRVIFKITVHETIY
ncbi:hypothetical protein D5F01_LYC08613 [Larimichthys crocea]|uniref:Ig-like domain-containing protein n=1 Tax=Larimichthys crocea TaxID=215358 RepID=A0A6G0IQD6_LARCR|nr:hypothetical protein D5F01_LYC08613 [Larimichthys crocea]